MAITTLAFTDNFGLCDTVHGQRHCHESTKAYVRFFGRRLASFGRDLLFLDNDFASRGRDLLFLDNDFASLGQTCIFFGQRVLSLEEQRW
jgi:hypothetical protein